MAVLPNVSFWSITSFRAQFTSMSVHHLHFTASYNVEANGNLQLGTFAVNGPSSVLILTQEKRGALHNQQRGETSKHCLSWIYTVKRFLCFLYYTCFGTCLVLSFSVRFFIFFISVIMLFCLCLLFYFCWWFFFPYVKYFVTLALNVLCRFLKVPKEFIFFRFSNWLFQVFS